MSETGIIIEINENGALIQTERKKACEKCRACFHTGGGFNNIYAEYDSEIELSAGDTVEFDLADGVLLKSAGIVYGGLIISFAAGTVLGYLSARLIGTDNAVELTAFLCGISFIAAYFLILRKLKLNAKKPVITKRIDEKV
jgi:positive regulator of sigma E activity